MNVIFTPHAQEGTYATISKISTIRGREKVSSEAILSDICTSAYKPWIVKQSVDDRGGAAEELAHRQTCPCRQQARSARLVFARDTFFFFLAEMMLPLRV